MSLETNTYYFNPLNPSNMKLQDLILSPEQKEEFLSMAMEFLAERGVPEKFREKIAAEMLEEFLNEEMTRLMRLN